VEEGKLALARLLRRQYAAALAADPALDALAERLEASCFGARQAGLGGVLGDMLASLAAGEGEGG
jgi:hypothetical protein